MYCAYVKYNRIKAATDTKNNNQLSAADFFSMR